MSRVFWDTMLFVYLLEGNPEFAPRVGELLERSYTRGDDLYTSHLAVGEVLAGARGDQRKETTFRHEISDMGFVALPFVERCVDTFARLRSVYRLQARDSIHLACAAASGMDLFLTNDQNVLKRQVHVSGIHFIADFNSPIL